MVTTLLNCRCIRSAGSEFFLPPYNSPQPIVTPEASILVVDVPFAGKKIVYNRTNSRTIDIRFTVLATNVAAALTFQDNLDAALRDSTYNARDVELCEWADYDDADPFVPTYRRFYRGCQVIDGPHWAEAMGEALRECTFTLLVPSPIRYYQWANGDQPGASPYAVYLYNQAADAVVDPEDPIPGEVAVPIANSINKSGTFSGVAEAAQEQGRVIYGLGTNVTITGIRIFDCGGAGDSATVIRISDTSGGGGSYIQITLAADARTAALASGDFTVAEGATIYIVIMSAGGHSDIQYEFFAESA